METVNQGDISKCESCGKAGVNKKKKRFCSPTCSKNKKAGGTTVDVNGTTNKVFSTSFSYWIICILFMYKKYLFDFLLTQDVNLMDVSTDAIMSIPSADSDLHKSLVPELPGVNPVVNWTVSFFFRSNLYLKFECFKSGTIKNRLLLSLVTLLYEHPKILEYILILILFLPVSGC